MLALATVAVAAGARRAAAQPALRGPLASRSRARSASGSRAARGIRGARSGSASCACSSSPTAASTASPTAAGWSSTAATTTRSSPCSSASTRLGYPIRRMELIDRYGADDHRSMAADNTSAFNCRFVAGTSRWSKHAYGLGDRPQPGREPLRLGLARLAAGRARAYADRSRHAAGMIHDGDRVVQAFARARRLGVARRRPAARSATTSTSPPTGADACCRFAFADDVELRSVAPADAGALDALIDAEPRAPGALHAVGSRARRREPARVHRRVDRPGGVSTTASRPSLVADWAIAGRARPSPASTAPTVTTSIGYWLARSAYEGRGLMTGRRRARWSTTRFGELGPAPAASSGSRPTTRAAARSRRGSGSREEGVLRERRALRRRAPRPGHALAAGADEWRGRDGASFIGRRISPSASRKRRFSSGVP